MYQRKEDESIRALYRIDAPWAESIPQDLERFCEQLTRRTRLRRDEREFPVDPATLARTAQLFVEEARHIYRCPLSLDNDAAELDRFIDAHLIDPILRPVLAASQPDAGGPSEPSEEWAEAMDQRRVPNEPLLFYALGAYWGEWLVRHQRCRWALYAPLNPVQWFPDLLATAGTVCIQPFSQVCRKLADPIAGSLARKAQGLAARKQYFPPFPLLASPADAAYAAVQLLPEPARRALGARQRGHEVEAFGLLLEAGNVDPENAQVLHMIVMSSMAVQRYDIMEGASYHLLELLPDHPVANHDLAALYASRPDLRAQAVELLEKALNVDPQYGRARMTLASCLRDLGRLEEARQQAAWVRDHDPGLKDEAEGLLSELAGLPS